MNINEDGCWPYGLASALMVISVCDTLTTKCGKMHGDLTIISIQLLLNYLHNYCLKQCRKYICPYKGIALVKVNAVPGKFSFNRYSFSNNVRPNQLILIVSLTQEKFLK